MDIINIIQQAVFYIVILGFIGYGLWKAWNRFKKIKEENYEKETYHYGQEKKIKGLHSFPLFFPDSPAKFKSLEELKGGRKKI